MAQTHQAPIPRAPVSPSASPDGTNMSSAGRGAFSSSHTSQINPLPNRLSAPITPTSSSPHLDIGMGRRANSKAPPLSRAPPTNKTPSLPSTASTIPTMNDITSQIDNLLPNGYYQCAGQLKTHSRCRRHVKNKTYCHSHDIQLLHAIIQNKTFVKNTIMEVKAHKGPIEDKLAELRAYLFSHNWAKIHVDNFEGLLRNIRKGPLERSERDQGVHALVPRWNRTYVCRGRTRFGRYCRIKTVGAHYCCRHDRLRIRADDVEMAFAAI